MKGLFVPGMPACGPSLADIESHWTVEELEKINDDNPSLFEWLCVSSWALIEHHRADVKKGYRGPSVKLLRTGRTGDPVLTAYLVAQRINLAAGGTVIAPWEVNDLPLEWHEGARAITTRLKPAQKANKIIEQKLAAWQANHPAYQKHL